MKTRKNGANYCAYKKRITTAKLNAISKKLKLKKPLQYSKKDNDNCKMTFQNPTCKGTFFEPGKGFSKEFIRKQKLKGDILKFSMQQRKEVFGNKTDVLLNGFYEKLPRKYINELKKHGAISACTRFPMD